MAAVQLSLKGRALRFLSMREHSRMELRRKLQRHAQEGDDVEALLDSLEQANWLSQERFSESLI
ncbi:MAG: recombination regulator RecX, partial [Janthinobacterium sp.]